MPWGFTYLWDMREMLDTTKGWKVASRGRCLALHEPGCGSHLVLGWVGCFKTILPDPQLCAYSICALLHCSRLLLY